MNDQLRQLGFTGKKLEELSQNKKTVELVKDTVKNLNLTNIDKKIGMVLYKTATEFPSDHLHNRDIIIEYVYEGKITNANFKNAIEYVKRIGDKLVKTEDLEKYCGIGIEYTDDKIDEIIKNTNETNRKVIFAKIKKEHPLIDPKKLMEKVNRLDLTQNENKDKKYNLPSPETNYQKNYQKNLESHLKRTNGEIKTRFPPEPNGHIHLGHALMVNVNFRFAEENNGLCIIRFDDTNPKKENYHYVNSILEDIDWLGFNAPVTFTSDYFSNLFKYAVRLILQGDAYVCFLSRKEIKQDREKGVDSPYRNQSTLENLQAFFKMKDGLYCEDSAVLRLKIDMNHPNCCMRDPIAYRIIKQSHYRTKTEWCIYPSYDFSHCIVDSLEDITHSLCSYEFEIRRELYNWILDRLDMYRPRQMEFKRLNIEDGLTSKSKIQKLLDEGNIDSWDDPRLLTIKGLRKRGFTKEGINNFCMEMGLSKNQQAKIEFEHLCEFIRKDLDHKTERGFAVFDPIIINIHTANKENSERQLYIERSDFREIDDENFYGLAPGKKIRLKNLGVIEYVNHSASIINVKLDTESKEKLKGVIHWIENYNERELIKYDGLQKIRQRIFVDNKIKESEGTIIQFERHGYYKFYDGKWNEICKLKKCLNLL